ncbi:hypothetical protein [Campylobacter troglodytis]|uniref:hypothetical protein n=1 Tax=Campylobacter troglodytis TaxID=654363 RepID=UPI00163BEB1E|nr:hypothetical protein [Campylobacter troglodytis]
MFRKTYNPLRWWLINSQKTYQALSQIPQSKLNKEAFIFGDNALFALKSKIEKSART